MKISQMIRTGMDTPQWLNHKVPRAPRSVAELVLDELKKLNEEITTIFSDVEKSGNYFCVIVVTDRCFVSY